MPLMSRSREGAWIEIELEANYRQVAQGRSREGAWIEISAVSISRLPDSSLPRGSVD